MPKAQIPRYPGMHKYHTMKPIIMLLQACTLTVFETVNIELYDNFEIDMIVKNL